MLEKGDPIFIGEDIVSTIWKHIAVLNAYNLANYMEDICDVARYSANTAVTVIKVIPSASGFSKRVIYVEVIHGANYITE